MVNKQAIIAGVHRLMSHELVGPLSKTDLLLFLILSDNTAGKEPTLSYARKIADESGFSIERLASLLIQQPGTITIKKARGSKKPWRVLINGKDRHSVDSFETAKMLARSALGQNGRLMRIAALEYELEVK